MCDTAADLASLFNGASMFDGSVAVVSSISSTAQVPGRYRFVAASTSPDNNQSQLVVVPGAGTGRWLRADSSLDLILPITFATADDATLVTIPAELTLLPSYLDPFWEMSAAWGGGIAPTIGLSFTNQATTSNPGSLLGGPAGDGTFPVVSFYRGTPGSAFAAGLKRIMLNPTATIRFNRINDAFTSGTGNAHVPCYNIFTSIIPVNPT